MRRIVAAMIVGVSLSILVSPISAQEDVQILQVDMYTPNIVISPDSEQYVLFEDARSVTIFEIETPTAEFYIEDAATGERRIFEVSDWVSDAVFTSDGETLITLLANGDLVFWDVALGEMQNTVQTLLPGQNNPLFLLPDGNTLILQSTGIPTRYFLYDIAAAVYIRILGEHFPQFTDLYADLTSADMIVREQNTVTQTLLTPDARFLFALDVANGITQIIIETNERREVRPPTEEPRMLLRVFPLSIGTERLAYWNDDEEQTYLIDLATLTESETLPFGSIVLALSPTMRRSSGSTRI